MFRMNVQNVLRWLQRRLSVACAITDRVVNHFLVQTVPFLHDTLAELFHVRDPVVLVHMLLQDPPHRVVDRVQLRTVRRPQRGRNEKQIMRRGRDCFWNTNILDFQISQGSVATQLKWVGSLYNRSGRKFPAESYSERIVKICVHLLKLWLIYFSKWTQIFMTKNKVAVFFKHGVDSAH